MFYSKTQLYSLAKKTGHIAVSDQTGLKQVQVTQQLKSENKADHPSTVYYVILLLIAKTLSTLNVT